ncbi:UNVERIFIED_CONTAM: hypothetical protein RKD50_000023 [Streptomyces canus]
MATRDDLHRLVDELPAGDIEAAADVLAAVRLARQQAARKELLRAVEAARFAVRNVRGYELRTIDGSAVAVPLPVLAEPPYPRSVGALEGAPADLSSNLDDYLAEGFGQ